MYDFGEERSLIGLLEQLKGAAVAAVDGMVAQYNSAARSLLPELREGAAVRVLDEGVIELCARQFEGESFELGEYEIFTFAAPASAVVELALPMLENMSRAMRESLGTAFAASELIAGTAERELREDLSRHSAMLRHEQYRLLNIAENLQELCALSDSGEVLQLSLFELDELCRKVCDTLSAVVADRGIKAEFAAEGAFFTVYADERRVERMLLAVLANSVEACKNGGNISLSLRRNGGMYELLLEDDGEGVPDEVFSDIFELYARPADVDGAVHGMGLGLAVARNTALRHGGNLMLQSAPGKGTRVLMSLPAGLPESPVFHSGRVEYAADPMRPILTALAGVLSYKYYGPPYI